MESIYFNIALHRIRNGMWELLHLEFFVVTLSVFCFFKPFERIIETH